MGKLMATSALMMLCDALVSAKAEIGGDVGSLPSHNLTSIPCSSAKVARSKILVISSHHLK